MSSSTVRHRVGSLFRPAATVWAKWCLNEEIGWTRRPCREFGTSLASYLGVRRGGQTDAADHN
jgi:hypothetical protein